MNLEQARALIKQTFTHAFDKTRFRNLTINLLNHYDESKAQQWNSQYVKDAFKKHINRYERLGTYTSPSNEKLDLLVVHLTAESKLERTRTAIRNFVADYLDKRGQKDAALVAFVSPAEKQWRFSYVKMEYATVEKNVGKVNVEIRLTPARRFSYIVGEGESCHTAQIRFVALLQDTDRDPSLAKIEEAFSVEAVTKEFFTKYSELFGRICGELEKLIAKNKAVRDEFKTKEVIPVDFAKKLMGQIVFLYFLQKKGWLGVPKGEAWGSGPHDFLRQLVTGERMKFDNFFNDVLEPLFYDTLATDRGHEAWCERFECRIPFLNGGLFEPPNDYNWRKTDIALPNELFSNGENADDGIKGTGVLDVFDRYNFTVNEAEPLEKEVAIDPEMLGKVFENLIEENRRKGLGAYYTPREIVHYMCQESLINYLDAALNKNAQLVPRPEIETFVHLGEQISHYEAVEAKYAFKMPKSIQQQARLLDENLASIAVCDPAVGSGAFPVGMMTEIVRARGALTPYFNDVHERTPYFFKRHAIQECLYGVDVDPGAVEIAKLRLWLSLVVDEEGGNQIKPLPNLDYKIVTGNSLLGVEKTLFNEQLFRRLEELKVLYFDESDKTNKHEYRREIDDLIHELTNNKQMFDFEIYFSEVFHARDGFDVVVGNPPYLGEKGNKSVFRELKAGPLREFYQRKSDLFYYFFHVALNIAKTKGSVAFITTNYYPTATQAHKMRSDLKKRSSILRLINFNEVKIFDTALGQHNMITVLRKEFSRDQPCSSCLTHQSGFVSSAVLQNILHQADSNTEYWQVPQADLYEGPNTYIRICGVSEDSTDPQQTILRKLLEHSVSLESLCNINQGILTGVDKIKKSHLLKFPRDNFQNGEGVFVISASERKQLSANPQVLKPWFKNSDIHRYYTNNDPNEFLIYATRDIEFPKASSLHRHFAKFEKVIRARNQDRGEMQAAVRQGKWWAIFAARRDIDFDGPKIVAPQRSYTNTFGYNDSPWYASADVYYITSKNTGVGLKYLLAILNSNLYFFWLYFRGKRKGEMLELYQTPLSEIPIKQPSSSQQQRLVRIVDKILSSKKRDPAADISVLESEVDSLVYEQYGLTHENIATIEASVGNRMTRVAKGIQKRLRSKADTVN